MILKSMRIRNFRGFLKETLISFNDLTVFIGKNDSGKSTILEALDAFFNGNIEIEDFCVHASSEECILISCIFSDLPEYIVLDSSYQTKLTDEYLTNNEGMLEIVKKFSCNSAKPKLKQMYINAFSPSAEFTNDLYELKITELKKRVKELKIDTEQVNMGISSEIRHAIWNNCKDLMLKDQPIDLLGSAYGKSIVSQIESNLPVFALFKSDRPSTDQDQEAQDPMKAAIKDTLAQHSKQLEDLQYKIEKDLCLIASKTVEKLKEMEPNLANELKPQVKHKNWDSLFSVSLTDDNQIPINKRGSGTRRLILLNFFRAKAEQVAFSQSTGIIYAVEEPETSQHPDHQRMLIEAFQDLVSQGNCQVILTTHTPALIRRIDQANISYVDNNNHEISVSKVDNDILMKIKKSLGILPDHDIKAFIGVEGINDINFFRTISKILSQDELDIPDLDHAENSGKLVFIPFGGSSLEVWISKFSNLNIPEFYITDRDYPLPQPAHYQIHVDAINQKDNCIAWITDKKELENYINIKAIQIYESDFPSLPLTDFSDIPLTYAKFIHDKSDSEISWDDLSPKKMNSKISYAKRALNLNCVKYMTPTLLSEIDTNDEIRSWLRCIKMALDA